MTTAQALAWAKTPYVQKLEEPKKEQLDGDCIAALALEVLRLSIVHGACAEALESYRAARA